MLDFSLLDPGDATEMGYSGFNSGWDGDQLTAPFGV